MPGNGRTWIAVAAVALGACAKNAPREAAVEGDGIRIEFNSAMHSRVTAKIGARETVLGEFAPSEFVRAGGTEITDFRLTGASRDGKDWTLTGTAGSFEKTVRVGLDPKFPRMAFFEVEYANRGASAIEIEGWTNNRYSVLAGSGQMIWSYQPGSYAKRPDWILPLKEGFRQENYLGMNATDYGGGTPVVDLWRRDAGIGVGHVEKAPKLVSLPVEMVAAGRATLGVAYKKPFTLAPGASLKTFRTFVAVHEGDAFEVLRAYREAMVEEGVRFDAAPESAFEPVWCAWGYGREMEPRQLFGALPVVKRLGFTWVTLDDGWQTAEGDWFLDPKKYPGGDRDMKALVGQIRSRGFKAQLWWAPLAADPDTKLLAEHPEQLLLNRDGSKQKISWWNSWYLCPADPQVVESHRRFVEKAMREWGFDGLKLDGQHMNGVPPCYNPAHRHAVPEDSVEALPRFFKAIYEAARAVKPGALVEFCPCGTAYSFFVLPYMNMSVASDPRSSFQIRSKGKVLKALGGDGLAYFGDHVEMSDGGMDFASTVGVGGVVGTNFTWPPGSAKESKLDLTPEREKTWAKWVSIYREKMLARGEYLGGLYDIGFDKPEAHAIRKDDSMYYAFFAPKWDGVVELRGLERRAYRLTGYDDGKDYGAVRGPVARIPASFSRYLLLEARPAND